MSASSEWAQLKREARAAGFWLPSDGRIEEAQKKGPGYTATVILLSQAEALQAQMPEAFDEADAPAGGEGVGGVMASFLHGAQGALVKGGWRGALPELERGAALFDGGESSGDCPHPLSVVIGMTEDEKRLAILPCLSAALWAAACAAKGGQHYVAGAGDAYYWQPTAYYREPKVRQEQPGLIDRFLLRAYLNDFPLVQPDESVLSWAPAHPRALWLATPASNRWLIEELERLVRPSRGQRRRSQVEISDFGSHLVVRSRERGNLYCGMRPVAPPLGRVVETPAMGYASDEEGAQQAETVRELLSTWNERKVVQRHVMRELREQRAAEGQ